MVEYMSTHPEIYMAAKEMHFFGQDLHFGSRFYRRDLAAYLAEFANWNGRGRAGEASVWYLFSKAAASEIKQLNPDSSIIIMLRDPVEMIHSLYHQFCCDANEHLATFEEALAAENDRRSGRRLCRGAYFPQGLVYRDVGRYSSQVRRYFEVFGRERVRVIIYDDFASDVAASYRETLRFLDVDPSQLPAYFSVVNGSKSVRSHLLRSIVTDPLIRSLAISISRRMGRTMFTALRSIETRIGRMNTRPEKRPTLAPELRAKLKKEFAPDVERLSELLGRDLTYWSSERGAQPDPFHFKQACPVSPVPD
jgi:hypothetical protein